MKHGLSHTLALISLGIATSAVTPVHAQTTAPGPYYATPSWDQTLPSATRFIVLSNFDSEAALDRETGLVWMRSQLGQQTWANASSSCLRARLGNRAGWRLPTINELGSVLDPSATAGPALPTGHPFVGFAANEIIWSATPSGETSGSYRTGGWLSTVVGFFAIFDRNDTPNNPLIQTWCVRGGLQAGTQ